MSDFMCLIVLSGMLFFYPLVWRFFFFSPTDLLTTNEQEIKLQQSYHTVWCELIAEIVSVSFLQRTAGCSYSFH